MRLRAASGARSALTRDPPDAPLVLAGEGGGVEDVVVVTISLGDGSSFDVRGSEATGANDAADRLQVQNKASIAQNAAFFARVNALGATLTPPFSLSKLVLVMSTGQLPPTAQMNTRRLLSPPFSAVFDIKAAAAPPPKGTAAKEAARSSGGGAGEE